jgi:hypothetical protein
MEAASGKEVLYDNMWRTFVENYSGESFAQGVTTRH